MKTTELDDLLSSKEITTHAQARYCHWPGCQETNPDVMEEDHIYEFVQYSHIRTAVWYFKYDRPFPFKLVRSWIVCSNHHSMITNMRIRGEEVPYTDILTPLIERVRREALGGFSG